jgi:hypothetical protein
MSYPHLQPVYGWAMNFTTGSQPYQRQRDIVGGPSSPLLPKPCNILQRDASDSNKPPFYTLGPLPRVICPYYNYILPDAYPYGDFDTACTPNPKQYWYYPYYKDPDFWKDPVIRIPKPG